MPELMAYDGFTGFRAGMDAGTDPSLLGNEQYSRGVNVSGRDFLLRTRPGAVVRLQLPSGLFQGCFRWSLNANDYVAVAIAGMVYVYHCDTYALAYTLPAFDSTVLQVYFEQVDRWLVIQDGVSRPVVLQEASGVVSLYGRDAPSVCLVVGTVMKYAHKRLHYVPALVPMVAPVPPPYDVVPTDSTTEGRPTFVSTDVRGLINPEYVLRMSEHRVATTGGAQALPQELGFITAMETLRNTAGGTGVGELIVWGREGVCAYSVNAPREQWLSTNIAQVLFRGAGTKSYRSPLSVNRDIVYVDSSGYLRRLGYDVSQMQSNMSLSNVPISNEMRPYVLASDPVSMAYASTSLVDNRFVWTTWGYAAPSFRALGVMDLNHLYALQVGTSVYDGIWTGFTFQQALSYRESGTMRQAFVAQGVDGQTNWLLVYSDAVIKDPLDTAIEAQVYTKFYSFSTVDGPAPNDLKELRHAELSLDEIKCDTEVRVYYRPRYSPTWSLMGSAAISVPGGEPQSRRAIMIPLDISTTICDAVSNERLCVGDVFQFCLVWTGNARIVKFRVAAALLPEEPKDVCETDNQTGAQYTGAEGAVLNEAGYLVQLGA